MAMAITLGTAKPKVASVIYNKYAYERNLVEQIVKASGIASSVAKPQLTGAV
jgi:hypothetical protein